MGILERLPIICGGGIFGISLCDLAAWADGQPYTDRYKMAAMVLGMLVGWAATRRPLPH